MTHSALGWIHRYYGTLGAYLMEHRSWFRSNATDCRANDWRDGVVHNSHSGGYSSNLRHGHPSDIIVVQTIRLNRMRSSASLRNERRSIALLTAPGIAAGPLSKDPALFEILPQQLGVDGKCRHGSFCGGNDRELDIT